MQNKKRRNCKGITERKTINKKFQKNLTSLRKNLNNGTHNKTVQDKNLKWKEIIFSAANVTDLQFIRIMKTFVLILNALQT